MNSLSGKVFADRDQPNYDKFAFYVRLTEWRTRLCDWFMTAGKALMFIETFNLWKTLLEYRGQIPLKALS